MADVKLEEAVFFLNQMRNANAATNEFRYYLSAFLQACWSAPEWLLFEYAEILLGMSLESYVDPDTFKTKAVTLKKTGDPRAWDFFAWWKVETAKIRNGSIGRVLTVNRHVIVHRKTPSFNLDLLTFESKFRALPPIVVGERTNAIPSGVSESRDLVANELFFADDDDTSEPDLLRVPDTGEISVLVPPFLGAPSDSSIVCDLAN